MSTGIAVGVGVGFIAIFALVIFMLLRYRRRKQISNPKHSENGPSGLEVSGLETVPSKPELVASSMMTEKYRSAVVTTENELHHDSVPSELPTDKISPSRLFSTQPPSPNPQTTPSISPASQPNLVNSPWRGDAGREEFGSPRPDATTMLTEAQSDEQAVIRRLEEEERRIDAEIAEHERLRELQEERAAVRAKLLAARSSKANPSTGNQWGTQP